MADIFLSYAREDLERARGIAEALQAEGWSVFWDRRIPPGRRFDDYIEEKIGESRVVVVLWSPHSVASDWVRTEAAHGRDRNPPALIPITIVPATIPFAFRQLQSADLSAWQPGERSVEYDEVLVEISRRVPRVHAAAPAPEPERHDPVRRVEAKAPASAAHAASSTLSPQAQAVLPDELVLPTNPVVHFMKIPAGPFLMGSDKTKDKGAYDDEIWPGEGQGSVTLSDFYIGKFPVTVAQFRACVDAKGCTPPNLQALGDKPDHPVVNVSWTEAVQYCAWLERTAKESPRASVELKDLLANGSRITLPSEAEWEKAARGTDGRTYPWGEGINPERANYGATKVGTTNTVGSYPRGASPYGVLDMSGNVWEWTRSVYKPYPYVASDGREDFKVSGPRVLRGGSFDYGGWSVRAANRLDCEPDFRSDNIGFRVVVSRF